MYFRDQKEDILMATDYGFDVYREFIDPGIKLGKAVLSPLRDEHIPSFSIYRHRYRGDIWYKDFSEYEEDFRGDCFQFVQAKFKLPSIKEAISVIKERVLGVYDGDSTQMKAVLRKNYSPKKTKVETVEFEPQYRSWTNNDLMYFNRFMIYQEKLEAFNVLPVSGYKMIKGEREVFIGERKNDPIYCIHFPSGRMKFYRPMAKDKRFKWVSNTRAENDVFGLHLLPEKCQDLFILAGNKDVMSFVATTGIPAIALSSESMAIPPGIDLILSSVANNIHVLYDNDPTGKKAEMNLCMINNYRSHGHLLTKFTENSGKQINDYSQLIDVKKHRPGELRLFFAMLKDSMKPKKFVLT